MGVYKTMILAIIPARGGSKRILHKNIKPLHGKPLIQYTIEAVEKSIVDDFVVSTEDKKIGSIVGELGVRVVARPKKLAKDWARSIDVVLDVLRNENPDIVICLQPTSPLRTAQDIDNAIGLFKKGGCESVISVCEAGRNHTWLLKTSGRYLTPALGHKYFKSQTLPRMFVPNGAIYISTPTILRKYKSFYTSKILPYVMPPERSVDIDNQVDFGVAEALIRK
jgi:CMP-N,N'-diacetyllegionaminic acid synthase